MIPDDLTDLLEGQRFAHVATIGPNGEPQSNPVRFAWDVQHVLLSQVPDRQKVRNLKGDPRIALSDHGLRQPSALPGDPRGRGFDRARRGLCVRGHAGEALHGYGQVPAQPGEQRLIVRVEPRHTTRLA